MIKKMCRMCPRRMQYYTGLVCANVTFYILWDDDVDDDDDLVHLRCEHEHSN